MEHVTGNIFEWTGRKTIAGGDKEYLNKLQKSSDAFFGIADVPENDKKEQDTIHKTHQCKSVRIQSENTCRKIKKSA